ncbi:MAG: peptide deformylase [bacterium]|nr:peptide deformylase [bacterium]
MAERQIVNYGDPVLREVAKPVEEIDQEIKDLVSDMVDTVKEANGLGLAAPQVGQSKRIFLVDLSAVDMTATLKVFINPEIVETEDEIEMEEGCLSFPGIFQKIIRPARVKVRATGLDGNQFEMVADGILARAILHEYDHLEGKLFIDKISSMARTMLRGRLRKLSQAS